MEPTENLISISDLEVQYQSGGGLFGGAKTVKAVDGVSLDIKKGETLGLVGESGCGKSTLGKAILRLTEPTGGKVLYNGRRDQRAFCKAKCATSAESSADDLSGSVRLAQPANDRRARSSANRSGLSASRTDVRRKRVQDLMETVGLSRGFVNRYPHEFSGGQRQRIGIARALAVDPEFIVADEPISALDVSIQAQIMNLLERLQAEKDLTYLFISHDLRAVRHLSDRVAVMYLGKIVELGRCQRDLPRPADAVHEGADLRRSGARSGDRSKTRAHHSQGRRAVTDQSASGCHFHTRCPFAIDECKTVARRLSR